MVIVCAVPNCPRNKQTTTNISTRSNSIQFHRFPLKKPILLEKWVKAMKLSNFKPTINTYLCSAHFKESDYDMKGNNKQLKPSAVPSILAAYATRSHDVPAKSKKVVMPESEESDADAQVDELEYVIEQLEDEDDDEGDQVMEEHEEEEEIEEAEDEPATPIVKGSKKNTKKKDENPQLTGLINTKGNNTLHLLIVGDNGQITNTEYLFKQEGETEIVETKPDVHQLEDLISYAEEPMEDDSNKVTETKKIEYHSRSSQTNLKFKEDAQINQNLISKSKEDIKKLEDKLALSRRKVKRLHKRCRKTEKRVKELKVLLKLLVLKRGKGVKNLSQLFEEYAKKTDSGTSGY